MVNIVNIRNMCDFNNNNSNFIFKSKKLDIELNANNI